MPGPRDGNGPPAACDSINESQIGFPPVSALTTRSASEVCTLRAGHEFSTLADGPQRVYVEEGDAVFKPNYDYVNDTPPFHQLSYALYEFELPFAEGKCYLSNNWLDQVENEKFYLGLANWDTVRWDWFNAAPKSHFVTPELDPYLDEGNRIVVAVVLMGTDWCTFDWLSFDGSAPVINSVAPLSGNPGENVVFSADWTGSMPCTYTWDFGEGASPTSASSKSPNVTLGDIGVFNGSLRIENELGFDEFDFEYQVGMPKILSISPLSGYKGQQVQLHADIESTSNIASYSWDLGTLCDPSTSTESDPIITIAESGNHPISLTVVNEAGGSDTLPATFVVEPLPEGLYIFAFPDDPNWDGVTGSGTEEDPYAVPWDVTEPSYSIDLSFLISQDGSLVPVEGATWAMYPPFGGSFDDPGVLTVDYLLSGYVYAYIGEEVSNQVYMYASTSAD